MTDEQLAASDTATEHKDATALQLPLARVKRMIKADTDLCPFSTDANVLITKATVRRYSGCQLFGSPLLTVKHAYIGAIY